MAFFVDDEDGADAPWPNLGDRVLQRGGGFDAAQLAHLQTDGNAAIAEGYLRAADVLAGAWLRGEAGRPLSTAAAAFSLPIIALYRHGLELSMKALLSDHSGQSEAEIASYSHRLDELWEACRAILWPYADEPSDDLLGLEAAVLDFHDFDPRNENARYSFDRKGGVLVLRNSTIDIAHLRDRMRAVANFLDCADTELTERRRYYAA